MIEYNALVGTQWRLSYGAPDAQTPVLGNSNLTLTFRRVTAYRARRLQRLRRQYSVAGDTLTVQNVVSTLMACTDDSLRREQAYLEGCASPSGTTAGDQP